MRKLSITTFLLAAFSFALLPTIASATSTPPFAYSPPTISGIAQSGQTLQVASDGLWTESALSYGYNWRDCDAALTACTDIAGATNTNSVVLSDADIGSVVIVVVTDYGISGPGTAHSAPTAVVIAASPTPTPGPKPPGAGIPANTSLPTISGKAKSKSQLTAKTGRWINGPTSYKYQWKSCTSQNKNCKAILGATKNKLMLSKKYVGHRLVVTVTAVNTSGKASATSKASSVIR